MKGATRRPPRCVCEDWKPMPASHARRVEVGVSDRDVLALDLRRGSCVVRQATRMIKSPFVDGGDNRRPPAMNDRLRSGYFAIDV